jgi:hypothetical protein
LSFYGENQITISLSESTQGQDGDVCGQLEQLWQESVSHQVESEWLDWLVSVAESLKGPLSRNAKRKFIQEISNHVSMAKQELISETEIAANNGVKPFKAKRKELGWANGK